MDLYGKYKNKFEILGPSNYYANIEFHLGSGRTADYDLVATAYINAPNNGYKILQEIEERLQSIANEHRVSIIYLVEPTNAEARIFFDRQIGYNYFDRIQRQTYYAKVFLPNY